MKYNKYDLEIGDRVIVDEGCPNSCGVEIISFTPNQMFATVKADDGYKWKTMTCRLTPCF